MSARSLRIGVLGCGQIAQAAHFEACRKADNAELYAICDVADDLRTRMKAIHQPQESYAQYDEMLADPHVEAVIVATADAFHVPAALRAVNAGKHVLVEKPLCDNLDDALRLQSAVGETGVVVQVGHMKRFDPGIAFAHSFIREEMGEMLALKAWYADSTYRYTMTDNLQPIIEKSEEAKSPPEDPKADRKRYYMMAHGSHLLDTARFLGGPLVGVRARRAEKFDAYCWFVDVEFASGALGHLDLTVAVRMDWHEGFQVYGEHGSVIGRTPNPWYLDSSEVRCFSTADDQYHEPLGADGHVYRRQVEGFVDAVRNSALMQGTTLQEGIESVRAMIAIARSVETGERVALDDVEGGL